MSYKIFGILQICRNIGEDIGDQMLPVVWYTVAVAESYRALRVHVVVGHVV